MAMRIGYPCLNPSLGCSSSRSFRLRNYSQKRLIETAKTNLDCLFKIIKFNVVNRIGFFRISSDLIPFASHKVCKFNWPEFFKQDFSLIGSYVKTKHMRISMHPDQFVLLNSPSRKIAENSVKELTYHTEVMELLGLGSDCKIQIHVGGVYQNKKRSLARFIKRYKALPKLIKRRLAIENDERLYSLRDCLYLNSKTGIPILFDTFHHSLNNNGESLNAAIKLAAGTWQKEDGLLMVDYSCQSRGKRPGSHANSLNRKKFAKFLSETNPLDFDIMLEIKDKEKSALKAIEIAAQDKRFNEARR